MTHSDLPETPDPTPADDSFARRFARFKVAAPVLVRRGDRETCLGMTYNAAVGGCCVMVGNAPYWAVGDALELTFEDDQRAHGTIRWIKGTLVAVEFAVPLASLVLDDAATPIVITVSQKQPLSPEARDQAA